MKTQCFKLVFTFFQKKGQGGNDQKGHFCLTKGHFSQIKGHILIDKRAISFLLAILCIYYRLVFTFLFERGRAYLSKKALTTNKKGTKGQSCSMKDLVISLIAFFSF